MGTSTLDWTVDTTMADPCTDFGYADWQQSALEVRRQWMRLMGLDGQEIEEHCANGKPTTLDEELSQLNAVESMKDYF